ncbi:hypothetical protein FGIG_10409 [Fasciola gigantica]|uniref:Uncharacterized protein n=1 Tax=Fasciola gigantica TaxID=46835 RepID=A0A504YL34_FASGI|nr:hypothetical protein FGIG_10409 [Fasciola gigantica]
MSQRNANYKFRGLPNTSSVQFFIDSNIKTSSIQFSFELCKRNNGFHSYLDFPSLSHFLLCSDIRFHSINWLF